MAARTKPRAAQDPPSAARNRSGRLRSSAARTTRTDTLMRIQPITFAPLLFLVVACADTPRSEENPAKGTSTANVNGDVKPNEAQKDHVAAVAKVEPPAMDATAAVGYPGLHNVVTYHEGFVCGS